MDVTVETHAVPLTLFHYLERTFNTFLQIMVEPMRLALPARGVFWLLHNVFLKELLTNLIISVQAISLHIFPRQIIIFKETESICLEMVVFDSHLTKFYVHSLSDAGCFII